VYSVPVLWDKKNGTIVNNESSEIIRILNAQFNRFAKNPDLDLYPEDLRETIDEVNSWVYPTINNGVYRCGFAQRQAPYEQAFNELFASLDKVEDILAKQRYIAGDCLTEADIRLFVTLIRFDPVYVVYFKTNKKFIAQYPNMKEYVKELYQMEGIQV
jgi:glutathionyl-hydroquinone reductase